MFLSIIIPAYNVESYVKDCLDSCLNQKFEKNDFEIIVINDGSTDSTLKVVNDYISNAQFPNIHVINQTNKGLSETRNVGLSMAQGEYVWFVDSDDWIAEGAVEGIYQLISQFPNTEVIALNTLLTKEGEKSLIDRKLSSVTGDGKYIYDNSYIYPYSGAQFYVFKKAFLIGNNITFKKGIYFEDCLFTPLVLSRSKQCAFFNTTAYIYRLRGNSITTSSISEKKLSDSIIVAEELISSLEKGNILFPDVIKDAACKTYEVLFRYYILKTDSDMQRKYLRIINSNNNWKSVLRDMNFKHKFYYLIMRVYSLFRG